MQVLVREEDSLLNANPHDAPALSAVEGNPRPKRPLAKNLPILVGTLNFPKMQLRGAVGELFVYIFPVADGQ